MNGHRIEVDQYGREWLDGRLPGAPDVVWPGLCDLPPAGWWCSRAPGHPGPCAARGQTMNDEEQGA